MDIKTDVCIVGGGPAGILLSYLLAKSGISTVVLERSCGVNRAFRGEHITSETENLLKEHHLFEKVEAEGILRIKKVEFFNEKKIIKTIKPASKHGHVGIHVPQANLLNVIARESASLSNHQLLMSTTVTSLLQDEQGTYKGVKAKRNGEELTIASSLIVGADGRFSTVRKLANIKTAHLSHGYDLLWAKIPAPQTWQPTTRMLSIDGHQLALFTQVGGFIQIGWNIKKGSFPALRKKDVQSLTHSLIKNFPELKGIVSQHLQSWKDFVCLKVESSRSETWVKDGLIIIGDAAHTMTPTGAIGINCAMKDAHVVAPIIKESIKKGNTSVYQLQIYEKLRREEIEAQQNKQIESEQSFRANFSQLLEV